MAARIAHIYFIILPCVRHNAEVNGNTGSLDSHGRGMPPDVCAPAQEEDGTALRKART